MNSGLIAFLANTTPFTVIIPFAVGFAFYQRLHTALKIFAWYFVLCIITEIAAYQMAVRYNTNIALLHLFVPLEFAFVAAVYYVHFGKGKIHQVIIVFTVLIFACAIAEASTLGTKEHNVVTRSLESILLVFLSMSYFFLHFREITETPVYREPMFWVSCGVLLYYSLDFFTFMMINILVKKNTELAYVSKLLHAVFNIFSYILYTISFTCRVKTTT